MSTSPVATTVSDAGAAEAAGAWVGAGLQPVSNATPSAASAIRTRPMRCPLPTAAAQRVLPPRPQKRLPPLLRGLPESRQLLRDSGQALRLTVCGATRIGLVFLGREASETAWCLSGGEAASGSAHAAYRSWPSSRRTAAREPA